MIRFFMRAFVGYGVLLLSFMGYAARPHCAVHLVNAQQEFNLAEDIIVSGTGSPFFATKSFGQKAPETVRITSNTGRSIIIDTNSTWDLSSFSGKNKSIEFAGNARLICRPGAKLIGKGGVLRFTDNSQWLIGME